jgi:polyisoprenoid-binding protein YceI
MTAATPTVQPPAAGTYRIDPSTSTITFTTRHMFGTAAVKGSFDLRASEITVAEPVTASHVAATAAADSFTTGNPKRDKHVRSVDFLHADTHPDISFRSTGLVHDGASWLLHGTITARGNTAPVELTIIEASTNPTGLTVKATGKVDRYAHNITKLKGMAARYLTLTIAAHAERV